MPRTPSNGLLNRLEDRAKRRGDRTSKQPRRIQRKNQRERLPDGCKLVARPSRWGNPFRVSERRCGVGISNIGSSGHVESNDAAVELYIWWLWHTQHGRVIADRAREELRGYDLACYCPIDQPCHADALLEIANR